MMKNRLYRDEQHKVIGGVCAGLADYFDVDISIVRVIFLLVFVLGGSGGLLYIILWIVVPRGQFNPSYGDSFDAQLKPNAYVPVKRSMPAGSIIGGLILIMAGGFLLLDELNIIPDIDFGKFWPVILIIAGLVMMFGFWRRHPQAGQKSSPETWKDENITTTDNT